MSKRGTKTFNLTFFLSYFWHCFTGIRQQIMKQFKKEVKIEKIHDNSKLSGVLSPTREDKNDVIIQSFMKKLCLHDK